MKDINQICDYIIFRLKSEGDIPLSNIKLQKLLYYTQAWHLAFTDNKPLFKGKFQAWIHGPVNRDIFDRFKDTKYLYSEILLEDIIDKNISEILSEEEIKHINIVLENYAHFSGVQLEDMSHNEAPWIKAREGYASNQRCEVNIDETFLGDFFRQRLG
jgi:uncharacterized phage-associated protein